MDPEIARLRARVEELEARMLLVERKTGLEPEPLPEPVSLLQTPAEAAEAPPRAVPPPIPNMPPPAYVPPVPPPEPAAEPAEAKAGLVWMNVAAAITSILGMAYLFKYAIDNDWIGPLGRILIGIFAGLAALAGAERLFQRGHKAFAKGLCAAGLTTVYLACAAAYQLYHLIPQSAAFLALVSAAALAGALALRYDAPVIAAMALLGGYIAPFFVSTGVKNDLFLAVHLTIVNGIAITAVRTRRWLSVELFGLLATSFLVMVWMWDGGGQRVGAMWGGLFALAQFTLFVWSPFVLVRMAIGVPAMLALASFCEHYSAPWYWTWALAMLAGGIAVAFRWRDSWQLLAALAAWVVGYLAWDPGAANPVFLGLTVGFLLLLAAAVRAPGVPLQAAGMMAGNAVFYFSAAYAAHETTHREWMGLLAVAVALVHAAAYWLQRSQADREAAAMVSAGLAMTFFTIAIPVQFSGYTVTIAWAVECAALAYVAARMQNWWPYLASWLVGFGALAHLLGVDADKAWGASYTPLLNERFIPFVVVAVAFAANAWFGRQVAGLPKAAPALPFLLAHFVLLVGLHAEVFAWIGARDPKGDHASAEALSSSVILGLYGLVLVATGFTKNFRPHRLLGLALFALVVAKLYLSDIWTLGAVYRIVAFVALGALMFLGSFLYSRYRERWRDLLKED